LRGRLAVQTLRHGIERFAGFQDRVRGRGGMLDDGVEFVVAKGMSLTVMSSTRKAAISAFAAAIVRPSDSTSVSSVVSLAVRSPLIDARMARTTSATMSGSLAT